MITAATSPEQVALQLTRALRRTCEVPHLRIAGYQPDTFHRHLGARLDGFAAACLAGLHPRLDVSAPPRHGKTELVGRSLGPRLMALRPGFSVLYATSTEKRAEEASRSARRTVETMYHASPITLAHLEPAKPWTDTEWTTRGGNAWVGCGSGGATGGIGAHLVVTDDVTGSAARARSAAWRSSTQAWLEEDVLSRLMRGGGALNTETRRGTMDTSGYLAETQPGRWKRAVYTCQAEEPQQAWDWRQVGAYLWETGGFGALWRAANPQLRGKLWARLYQQRPSDEAGTLWIRDWFDTRYPGTPEEVARSCELTVFAVDPAATEGDGDHSVIQWWGFRGTDSYLLRQWRGQWGYPRLKQMVTDHIMVHRPRHVLVENTSNGRPLIDDLKQGLPIARLEAISATGGKQERWASTHPAWSLKRVHLPSPQYADWLPDFIDRMVVLEGEGDEVDDEADAASIALRWYAGSAVQPLRRRAGLGLGA